ncbi:uncharacterized protein EDB91DRAFT_1338665 [Suillus paluster]|uniref:uncharacterized protein n=1 Tax=Suillus paluster TaxID=48578 RepID=UPI001B867554|nr:uncharacterized protein EDB91DRAFT_1338665 [Suillus paluster]KAG1731082.1 hypothetical protein EDB91DRAFT_1338665 [Suillus paluster]
MPGMTKAEFQNCQNCGSAYWVHGDISFVMASKQFAVIGKRLGKLFLLLAQLSHGSCAALITKICTEQIELDTLPLTYTLGHLQKLIKFVFQPAKESEMGGSYNFRHATRHASLPLHARRPVPSSSKGKQPALDLDPEPGHLFEVQQDIEISRSGKKTSGKTLVKASTMSRRPNIRRFAFISIQVVDTAEE